MYCHWYCIADQYPLRLSRDVILLNRANLLMEDLQEATKLMTSIIINDPLPHMGTVEGTLTSFNLMSTISTSSTSVPPPPTLVLTIWYIGEYTLLLMIFIRILWIYYAALWRLTS